MPEEETKPQPGPAITPRRNPILGRSVPEDETDQELEEWNDLVHNVKALSHQMGVAGKISPQRPAAPEGRDKSLRRWKKVAKPGSSELKDSQRIEVPDAPVLTLPGQSRSATAAIPPSALMVAAPAPAPPVAVRVRSPRPAVQRRQAPTLATVAKRNPLVVMVAAQGFGFGLLLTGFALGKFLSGPDGSTTTGQGTLTQSSTGGSASSAFVRSRGVSDRAFQAVERILEAGKKGDASEMKRLLEDSQREHIDVPGSDYRLAMLALQRGDGVEAKLRLDLATAASEQIGACSYLSAMIAGAGGHYSDAATAFATAVYSDPFNARHLFFLGEALRRDGKPAAAIARLEQALIRPGIDAETDYLAYKLRLAKIEAGRDSEVESELAERLKGNPTAGSWLLTAAALRLQRGKPAEAAGFLQQATRQMQPEDYNSYLRDFFFVPYSRAQEVAPYFIRKAIPAPDPVALKSINYNDTDPATWPLQKADPANWPPAAPNASTAPFRLGR